MVVVVKNRVTPLPPDGAKRLTICAFVSIQYQHVLDRQTDRLIFHNNIVLWMHRHADERYTAQMTLVLTCNEKYSFIALTLLFG